MSINSPKTVTAAPVGTDTAEHQNPLGTTPADRIHTLEIHSYGRVQSSRKWSYSFIGTTGILLGMLLASWYYPDTPDSMMRLICCLAVTTLVSAIMAALEMVRS